MGSYTRPQLTLLLALLAATGVGLGVRHWRATHPQLAERLEVLDREIVAGDEAGGVDREASQVSEPKPPRARRGDSDPRSPARARPAKRQAPLEPSGPPLDLNQATEAELMRLPGVGPVLARRILDARETAGRFGGVDDLVGVRGLGRAKLERLRPFVGVLE
jgi:competence protein ComEA